MAHMPYAGYCFDSVEDPGLQGVGFYRLIGFRV